MTRRMDALGFGLLVAAVAGFVFWGAVALFKAVVL